MLSFMLFAFVSSITPGPTNILVLSNSARYGLRASLPIILGGCMGAAALVLLVGTGVGRSLVQVPGAQSLMSVVGVAWLTWLAGKIFSDTANPLEQTDKPQRLGFIGAAGLQVVNPKTWMMALAVVGVFSQSSVTDLALVFFLVSLPCMTSWALLGTGSARLLKSAQAMQRLNRCMAVLLLVSAWAGFLQ
ncbi:LysE family translocator [Pseudomonas sp. NPDC089734]|uniref:LysE family translocator n=1 Tax=Pseudomonas sp. NPDC089734 TaxID=3364469 RepID=UPI00380DCAC6